MNVNKKVYLKAIVNICYTVILLLLCLKLLPRLLAFFSPFIIGWIIASLASPIVHFCEEKMKIRRKAGSAFVIILAICLIVFLLYTVIDILVSELSGFSVFLPELWNNINSEILSFGHKMQGLLQMFPKNVQHTINSSFSQMGEYITEWVSESGTPTVNAISNVAKQVPTVIVCIVVCLLSSYFFVSDRQKFLGYYEKFCPPMIKYRLHLLINSVKNAIGGYFKAQFKIEIWIYILLVVGLMVLKVEYAWVIAIGIAILDFLPIFGTGTVMIPWAVIKLVGGDYKMAIGLIVTWGVGQLARQIIQPKIVGDSIGVPALPTLVLIYLGYRFGGVGGMIIALPVGLILMDLYAAGVFVTTVKSYQILIAGFNEFRKITPEDMKVVRTYQNEVQEKIRKMEQEEDKAHGTH